MRNCLLTTTVLLLLGFTYAATVIRYTLVLRREAFTNMVGQTKYMITVNHTIPGPTIRVAKSQSLAITVINELGDDYTTVHWHGLFQRTTNYLDGPIGSSQCPINFNAKGSAKKNLNSLTYNFKVDNSGTFWYHGHFKTQYVDGLYGPLIVEDTASITAGYAAKGLTYSSETTLMIADWYDNPAATYLPAYLSPASEGDEPGPDAIVVNNTFSNILVYKVGRKDKIRIRIVNAAAFSMFSFSVDGMPLQVIELDGSPVNPLSLSHVVLNVAQRVSVVLDFSLLNSTLQAAKSIYFRVKAMPEMYPTYNETDKYFGIYGQTHGDHLELEWTGRFVFTDGKGKDYPESAEPPSSYPAPLDTNLLQSTLLFPSPLPPPDLLVNYLITFFSDSTGVNRAHVNGATFTHTTLNHFKPMLYDYLTPSGGPLSYKALGVQKGAVIKGDAINPFVIPFNRTLDVIFNNTDGGEHPLHFHGYNFWVLRTSEYDVPNANPVKRDVVSVPALGWAHIRLVTDNPGIWPVHCHIDWHIEAGFYALFVIAPEKLNDGSTVIPPDHFATCQQYAAPSAGGKKKGKGDGQPPKAKGKEPNTPKTKATKAKGAKKSL